VVSIDISFGILFNALMEIFMPAYMIVTVTIHDRARFIEDYAKPTAALIERFGGKYIVRGPACISVEGGRPNGMSAVVSEFPDMAAYEAFWNCPEYQPLKLVRQTCSNADIQVLEVA
jgi:uncharacterized protein (DUF1330 family)